MASAKTKGKPKGKAAPAKAAKPAKATKTKRAAKAAAPKAAKSAAAPKPAAAKPAASGAKPAAKMGSVPISAAPTPQVALPLPPPPPRDELPAPRDIGKLLRYGEKFGASKIDVRMLPMMHLPVASGQIAIFDPAQPKSWRVLDRPTASGQFGVMVSIARDAAGKERLAAIVIHTGRPPIARWTVAHYHGQKKPKSADQLPRLPSSGRVALVDAATGSPGAVSATPPSAIQPIEVPLTDGRKALVVPSGDGEFAAYWAVDASDKPIALVLDFDVFPKKDWR